MLNVLFLCTGNSCRSIMAEGLMNHYGKGRFHAFSAGSFPTGKIHPFSLATLEAHGISTVGYRSKSWDEFTSQTIDIVITVCDAAANETCPIFHGAQANAYWGVADPAHFHGTPEEIKSEFSHVFKKLERRIKALIALPVESFDNALLVKKLHEISKL